MSSDVYNNLSDKELKYGYWLVKHRVLLRRLLVVVIGFVSVSLLFFGIWGLFKYFIVDYQANLNVKQDLARNKVNYSLLAEVNQPQPLQIVASQGFNATQNQVDFLGQVFNSNTQWVAESFDYYFVYSGGQTEVKQTFALPGQEKYIVEQAISAGGSSANVTLVIENVQWKKVADFENLHNKIMQFEIDGKEIKAIRQQASRSSVPMTNVVFDIKNKGPYNFWEPKFIIIFRQGTSVIGVEEVVLGSINSGEVVHKDINIFKKISIFSKFEVIPDINIADENVFKGFDVGSGEIK